MLQTGFVTYNEIWDLTFNDIEVILRAYNKKRENEVKSSDFFNWQLGMYFKIAVGSLMSKECKYPEEPIFSKRDYEEEINDEERLKKERERAFLYFSNLGKHMNIKN